MKWIPYSRGHIPLYRAAAVLLGVQKYTKKFDKQKVRTLYFNTETELLWSWHKKDIWACGKSLLERVSTKKGLTNEIGIRKTLMNLSNTAANKIISMDLKKLNYKELGKEYVFMKNTAIITQGATTVSIDSFDVVFEEFFYKLLRTFFKNKMSLKKFEKIYANLIRPICQSYSVIQHMDIIKAAMHPNKDNAAKLHKKYWWTNLGWENVVPHSQQYFKNEITKEVRKGQFKQRLTAIDGHLQDIKNKRQEVIKQYKLSPEIQHYLTVLDKYTIFHDERKEMQVRSTYALRNILDEIASRRKYNPLDLECLWYDEVLDILKGQKLDKKEVRQRRRAVAVMAGGKKVQLWSGKQALVVYNKEYKGSKRYKGNIIKGMGVSPGKVIGLVKVCQGVHEALKKMRKGNILVCSMTLPDYVPVMKIAKAIITDEGGLTCHAAIISRELGIPCVISTKNATSRLKDGDKVEVDANKGIINKI